MTPRAYLELALIVLATLAGLGYVHQRDERLRAEGRLELLEARADSTARAAEESVDASDRRAAEAEERASRAEAIGLQAQRRANAAAARVPAAADSVVMAAAPVDSAAVRAALEALQGIYDERDGARLTELQADSVIIAELRAVDLTRVAAIASLEAALSASQAEAAAALSARPGWIERSLPRVLVPLAFIAGLLVQR